MDKNGSPFDKELDKTLVVSEHVSHRVAAQKITPAQAMGDILTALLEKMSPQEQMVVEKQLNDKVSQLDEKTRGEVLLWRSPYEPKTEEVKMELTFERQWCNVPVWFTLVGDIIHMTVRAWSTSEHTADDKRFIKLWKIPEKYCSFTTFDHRVCVYDGALHPSGRINHGLVHVNNSGEIIIGRMGTSVIEQFVPFSGNNLVGFCQFTVTYSIK